ncbi:hypothetical protein ABZ635_01145 [Nocardiopsis sp. NPDC007018]|uniref:hypothetical protein n=1 Tax=Nocardiopsis sp. NPDC007018 TaxID=3155721 RepID=UPI0033CF1379
MNPPPPRRRSTASALLAIGLHQARAGSRRWTEHRRAMRRMRDHNRRELELAFRTQHDAERAADQAREEFERTLAELVSLRNRREDRARWFLLPVLCLCACLVLTVLAGVWGARNRALDERGITVYAQVREHHGGSLQAIYLLEGRRVLFTVPTPSDQQVDRQYVQRQWRQGHQVLVRIDVVPDTPAIVRPHGERWPAGTAALGALACLVAAGGAFAWHARVSARYPLLPGTDSLRERSRGALWSSPGITLVLCGLAGCFFLFLESALAEPVVDPRTTKAVVEDYWKCEARSCIGYDGELSYTVDGVEYRATVSGVPPRVGAPVEIRYWGSAPHTVVATRGQNTGSAGFVEAFDHLFVPALLLACVGAAFYAPIDYRIRRGEPAADDV